MAAQLMSLGMNKTPKESTYCNHCQPEADRQPAKENPVLGSSFPSADMVSCTFAFVLSPSQGPRGKFTMTVSQHVFELAVGRIRKGVDGQPFCRSVQVEVVGDAAITKIKKSSTSSTSNDSSKHLW
ncbi:hypothetical protein E4U46_007662 [Claviceps purpurea]|nr:hypothetical protein E4U46_007662 [Claviceps purpurea]